MNFELYDPQRKKIYTLEDGVEMVAGRSPECDVFVYGSWVFVSNKHLWFRAEVRPNFGSLIVRDVGSTNGTYTRKGDGSWKDLPNDWSNVTPGTMLGLGSKAKPYVLEVRGPDLPVVDREAQRRFLDSTKNLREIIK